MSVASRTMIDRSELEQEVESDMAVNEEVESFATCPRCGWDRYTQRAIRS
jgi:hypothetical protein